MIPRLRSGRRWPAAVAVVLAALAALALSACGAKKDTLTTRGTPQRIDLVLDYLPNADHAAIYAAQATGAFRAAGLDVRIRVPSDPAAPLKLVAAGRADLAISYEPELLLARDKGLRVASIGALVQKPLTSIISLGGKVRTAADLEGKTVGTAGIPYQSAYLKTIARAHGFDPASIKEVNVGFNLVPAMLSKKVDATLGAFWNVEGVQLRRQNKHPTIIHTEQAGVPTYEELVIVAGQDELRTRGDVMRRFVQAVARGAKAVRKDPQVGVDALVKADKSLDPALTLASIKATLPAFFPADAAFPWGYQNADEWKAYGQWMLDNGLVKRLPTPTSLTNEFLPGRGI
ncbi:ABC transporter substrate-binding protein [Baekduia soli]|uniref:ABC transporter substrate-binding protein n=1 Tax=Baekduia soli TaxID=496014 RepID=A0A5B8UAD1_9ACTN|nr:ABC transporter substrate-binding protein [Baekduia soli]QEC50159.1 ABC transporter substrate-binding protein [Baekduia soli]